MKIVLVGAVESTKAALDAMLRAGNTPALLVTLPADLSERHSDFFDLADAASEAGVSLHRTRKTESPETQKVLRDIQPDLIIVIGWSQICGPDFLSIPRIGCLGFHPSALPKLRGRAVIPWTILNGESSAGASFFWIDNGTDTGDIAAQKVFAIDPDTETARSLYDRQLSAIETLLVGVLEKISEGDIPRRPQDHDSATWCARRRPADSRIDWSRSSEEISRLIRAVGDPYPSAFTLTPGGSETVSLLSAYHDTESHRYLGLPGQIQSVGGDSFRIKCGDGRCLIIDDWSPSAWRPKPHERLE